jgi:hypothetical protein
MEKLSMGTIETEKSVAPVGIKPIFLGHPIRSLAAVSNELSGLHIYY